MRFGLGDTEAGLTTRLADTSDSSVGVVLGLGTTFYVFDHVGLSLEAAWRSDGLALRLGGKETSELQSFGLTLGVMFR